MCKSRHAGRQIIAGEAFGDKIPPFFIKLNGLNLTTGLTEVMPCEKKRLQCPMEVPISDAQSYCEQTTTYILRILLFFLIFIDFHKLLQMATGNRALVDGRTSENLVKSISSLANPPSG